MENEISENIESSEEQSVVESVSEPILASSAEAVSDVVEENAIAMEESISVETVVDSVAETDGESPAVQSVTSEEIASSDVSNDTTATEEGPTLEEIQAKTLEEIQAKLPWYVVHTHSGFEGRVKLGLEERIRNAKLQTKFGKIIVPQEKVVELVKGEKKTSTRKFFPGYMLIQLELNDETWHLVKDTPKVTGFVGDMHNPVPLTPQEVQNLFQQMEGGAQRPRAKAQYEVGDSVKIIDGPFADFNGSVDEVKPEKGKLRVLISIFGRNTPVELDFVQVEKV